MGLRLGGTGQLSRGQGHLEYAEAVTRLEHDYHDALSEDSRRSLGLQGGVFGKDGPGQFAAMPHAAQALRLRRWDDAAKVRGAAAPPLDHYLEIAAGCTL